MDLTGKLVSCNDRKIMFYGCSRTHLVSLKATSDPFLLELQTVKNEMKLTLLPCGSVFQYFEGIPCGVIQQASFYGTA